MDRSPDSDEAAAGAVLALIPGEFL